MGEERGAWRASPEHLGWRLVEGCRAGNLAEIRAALREGASPNAAGYGETAVSWAAALESPEALRELLRAGGDPSGGEGKTDYSSPSLWSAGRFGRERSLEMLLEAGADPNGFLPGTRGTAGHCAAALQRPGMIEALLEAGWDPTRRSPDGKTPREIALGLGLEGIARRLLRAEESWRLGRSAAPARAPGKRRGM